MGGATFSGIPHLDFCLGCVLSFDIFGTSGTPLESLHRDSFFNFEYIYIYPAKSLPVICYCVFVFVLHPSFVASRGGIPDVSVTKCNKEGCWDGPAAGMVNLVQEPRTSLGNEFRSIWSRNHERV